MMGYLTHRNPDLCLEQGERAGHSAVVGLAILLCRFVLPRIDQVKFGRTYDSQHLPREVAFVNANLSAYRFLRKLSKDKAARIDTKITCLLCKALYYSSLLKIILDKLSRTP